MHHFFSMMFSLLAIIGPVSVQSTDELKVKNGGPWGSWGSKDMCPSGTYANAFSLKVESFIDNLFGGDDTALNGIRLHCVDRPGSRDYSAIASAVGGWGEWSDVQSCPSGFLTAFQLKVESRQEDGDDDTAANLIGFKCSGGDVVYGEGKNWGNWGDFGDWSPTCEGKGICGLQTRVEESQGSEGDDTALNDVIMFCCD
ncbi:hypothetical protein R3I93_014234 [Phoxinus phoxinus]|uniref:Vitelline membrane outer layer protein 1 homolog n=1 Tax=Phoxinus phoxinus TaxID=58324 RepID=A0AAN9H0X2_9TELE